MKISDKNMELAAKLGAELMKNDVADISDKIINHSDAEFQELAQKLDLLFREFARRQEGRVAGPVKYINFTYLYSSVLTESFDVLIYLSDSRQYEGVNGVHGIWKPAFIMDYYEKSKKVYERYLYERLIGIKKSEVHEMMILFGIQYFRFIYTFLSWKVPDIMELDSYLAMDRTEDMEITFGALYDDDYDILNLFEGVDLDQLEGGDEA